MKKFIVGKTELGRRFIQVHKSGLVFSIWRDIMRLSGHSYNVADYECFEFLDQDTFDQGKRLLISAMFEEQWPDMPEVEVTAEMWEEHRIKNS